MKKHLIPIFILTSLLCAGCASQQLQSGQFSNSQLSNNKSDNSQVESNKKSEYSSIFAPDDQDIKLLKKLPVLPNYNRVDKSDVGYKSFLTDFNTFSSSFSDDYIKKYFDSTRNDTISPLSIYFAMAQAGACTAGTTQKEIFDSLNISYDQAIRYSSDLYKATNRIVINDDNIVSIEDINNSLWFEKTLPIKQTGVDTLVDSFFCETYAANFKQKPSKVSNEISDYISDKTRGLIKPDLDFDEYTRFVILNTLYMKDQWTSMGDDLPVESKGRDFINYDGSKTNKAFLIGSYEAGTIHKSDDFSSFYVRTANGFQIRFMIPNEGKKLDEVFNKDNILEMHNADYYNGQYQVYKNYYTRCIFPEFEASAPLDLDLIEMFKERGITQFFRDADLSNILESNEENIRCSAIKHLTKLIVNKKGVEGAAVTIIVESATSVGGQEEKKYQDFIIDKAFGFEISDYNNIPLFTGVINKI